MLSQNLRMGEEPVRGNTTAIFVQFHFPGMNWHYTRYIQVNRLHKKARYGAFGHVSSTPPT